MVYFPDRLNMVYFPDRLNMVYFPDTHCVIRKKMNEEEEEKGIPSPSTNERNHIASYPIHTIRGVYDSMLYIHTLVCNISESVTRVARNSKTTNIEIINDEEEVTKTVDYLKRSLDGTDRRDSLIIEGDDEEEEEDDEGDEKDEKKKTKKSPRGNKKQSSLKKNLKKLQIQKESSTSKLLHILPEAVSNGLDAILRRAMSAIPGNRKGDIVLQYDVVLHILPSSLSSKLSSLIEKARTGPQPQELVSNLVESVKQKFLPGFWVYNAKCIKPYQSIPRSPSEVALTGYVLEYDVVDETQSRNLARYMHYDIDRRPFIATVSVPSNTEESSLVEKKIRRESMEEEEEGGKRRRVTTPQSFPPSPYAREALLNDFASYTNGVLQAASDRLRSESDEDYVMPQMNPKDTHEDLRIDCVGLRVSKFRCHQRFVSSRANLWIDAELKSRNSKRACLPFFFEFVVAEHFEEKDLDGEDEEEEEEEEGEEEQEKRSCKLCVGLSTERMPLNACTGMMGHSVGYHSDGNVLINGKCFRVKDGTFGGSAVIGILCQVDSKERLRTAFTMNGRLVAKPAPVSLQKGDRLFPTISIGSPHVSVTCNFTPDEILYPPKCSFRGLKM